MISTVEMEKVQARQLVQECYMNLEVETAREPFKAISDDIFEELEDQRFMAKERISDLQWQIASRAFDGHVRNKAKALLPQLSSGADDPQGGLMDCLLEGVGRALIEQQHLFMRRLEDRLLPYLPVDPLFAECGEIVAPSGPQAQEVVDQKFRGPTLGDAISKYLATHHGKWTTKTHVSRVRQLEFLKEALGEDRPLTSIEASDIRQFRDDVLTLRKNHGRADKQSFLQKQTDQVEARISNKTGTLIFEPTKAFFRWAQFDEGMLKVNPAEGIRIVAGKGPKGQKSRRPFAAAELTQLFSAPLFTGCRSVKRRSEPGDVVIKDAKFWLPILGYYTGARLGELVQLHIQDVHLGEAIPYISIDEQNDGLPDGSPQKHVKSSAGVRKVPLHHDLLKLGFEKFVELRRRSVSKHSKRLFPEFPYGADGQASTVASKWFGRFMNSVGLTDPRLVFHSLRHNAEDALRDALQPQYVIDRIIGHSDGSVSAGYGQGPSLSVLQDAITSGMTLPMISILKRAKPN